MNEMDERTSIERMLKEACRRLRCMSLCDEADKFATEQYPHIQHNHLASPEQVEDALTTCRAYDWLPYYVTCSKESFGDCINVLCVGPYECDWPHEFSQVDTIPGMFQSFAYVENADFPICSEPGTITVAVRNKTLVRV